MFRQENASPITVHHCRALKRTPLSGLSASDWPGCRVMNPQVPETRVTACDILTVTTYDNVRFQSRFFYQKYIQTYPKNAKKCFGFKQFWLLKTQMTKISDGWNRRWSAELPIRSLGKSWKSELSHHRNQLLKSQWKSHGILKTKKVPIHQNLMI